MSEPYDPYVPRNGAAGGPPAGGSQSQGNAKTAALQADIDSTVEIMHANIIKVTERGAALEDLQEKTDHLAESAQSFRRGANQVRKVRLPLPPPSLHRLALMTDSITENVVRLPSAALTLLVSRTPLINSIRWKDMKMRLIIGTAIAVIIIIVVVSVVKATKH
ncbi:hypothetical protein B0H19DRAFT_1029285 [Mycena capillaripes]|nr:hypothetical protein B0H19DRAFT_1029285 [Mycena capillaripes]